MRLFKNPLLKTVKRAIATTTPARSGSASQQRKSAQYCVDLVKRRSFEHYLTSLLLPDDLRRCSFAVRALSAEVSRTFFFAKLKSKLSNCLQVASVRDVITAKHAGMGRMVFWRETIETMYDDKPKKSVPNHPVALELHWAVKQVIHIYIYIYIYIYIV